MELKKEKWTKKDYKELKNYLKSQGKEEYVKFSKKLVKEEIDMLGIRIPILKKISKEISKGDYKSFLKVNENSYYEEIMLEGLVIGNIKDKTEFDFYLDFFVNKINNWAICDTCCANMKIIKKNQDVYLPVLKKYAKSKKEYQVRFSLVCLLDHYKEEKYAGEIFEIINTIKLDTYYVNMAIAWLLCEMFIQHKEFTLKNLSILKINCFTFNKFISKCCDSYRISKEDKVYLKNNFEKNK